MKQKAFCVMDSKTAFFGLPFFQPTVASGQRMFEQLVNDKSSLVGQYPEDFALYLIGEFDDDTGALLPAFPENLGSGSKYLRKD